jgi:uncharacterized membrane protein (UPF0182 family)
MQGDNMSYAKSFDQALAGLFNKTAPPQNTQNGVQQVKANTGTDITLQQKIQAANEAFNNYLKYNGDKRFSDAAKELEKLQQSLQELMDQQKNTK